MTRRMRWLLVALALLTPVGLWAAWDLYAQYREWQFTRELSLVVISTSMLGMPRPESEEAAFDRAAIFQVDLFRAYQHNLAHGPRFSLAWMLISKESPQYFSFARKSVNTIPWPEVRVWAFRSDDEQLSQDTRDKLRELLLASPTSEAKLCCARRYLAQGKLKEAEDAFYDAMNNGLFWDSLDAADALRDSDRYRHDAARHLLKVVRESEHFTQRAAQSLLSIYGLREELKPLVKACEKEQRDGKNRKALVARLSPLVDVDLRPSKQHEQP